MVAFDPGSWQGDLSQALPLDACLGRKEQAGPEQALQGDENCCEWPKVPLCPGGSMQGHHHRQDMGTRVGHNHPVLPASFRPRSA